MAINVVDFKFSSPSAGYCDPNGDGKVDKKDAISVFKICKNNGGDTKTCIGEAKAFMDEFLP